MSELDNAIDDLRASIRVAVMLYNAAREQCQITIDNAIGWPSDTPKLTPGQIVDTNGRPLLLDSHMSILAARVALVNALTVRASSR